MQHNLAGLLAAVAIATSLKHQPVDGRRGSCAPIQRLMLNSHRCTEVSHFSPLSHVHLKPQSTHTVISPVRWLKPALYNLPSPQLDSRRTVVVVFLQLQCFFVFFSPLLQSAAASHILHCADVFLYSHVGGWVGWGWHLRVWLSLSFRNPSLETESRISTLSTAWNSLISCFTPSLNPLLSSSPHTVCHLANYSRGFLTSVMFKWMMNYL